MTPYFRVTAYHPKENQSAIFDSHGMFEKIWQFSSYLIGKGFKILEVTGDDKFIDVNLVEAEYSTEQIYLRANCKGRPESIAYRLGSKTYQAVKVGGKIYIPDAGNIVMEPEQ